MTTANPDSYTTTMELTESPSESKVTKMFFSIVQWYIPKYLISEIYEVESRAGYPESIHHATFWGFFIYILLLNIKNLSDIV